MNTVQTFALNDRAGGGGRGEERSFSLACSEKIGTIFALFEDLLPLSVFLPLVRSEDFVDLPALPAH